MGTDFWTVIYFLQWLDDNKTQGAREDPNMGSARDVHLHRTLDVSLLPELAAVVSQYAHVPPYRGELIAAWSPPVQSHEVDFLTKCDDDDGAGEHIVVASSKRMDRQDQVLNVYDMGGRHVATRMPHRPRRCLDDSVAVRDDLVFSIDRVCNCIVATDKHRQNETERFHYLHHLQGIALHPDGTVFVGVCNLNEGDATKTHVLCGRDVRLVLLVPTVRQMMFLSSGKLVVSCFYRPLVRVYQ